MLTINEIRVLNIAKLRERYGPRNVDFARAIGKSEPYTSQICANPPLSSLGDKTVRDIEEALGLPRGWMDHEHHGGAASGGLDEALTTDCIAKIMDTVEREQMKPLSPAAFATAFITLYNTSLSAGEVADPLPIIRLSILAEHRS